MFFVRNLYNLDENGRFVLRSISFLIVCTLVILFPIIVGPHRGFHYRFLMRGVGCVWQKSAKPHGNKRVVINRRKLYDSEIILGFLRGGDSWNNSC